MQVEMVLAGLAVEFISRAPLECRLLMRLGLAAGAHALVLIPFYTRIQKFCPSWGLTNFLVSVAIFFLSFFLSFPLSH